MNILKYDFWLSCLQFNEYDIIKRMVDIYVCVSVISNHFEFESLISLNSYWYFKIISEFFK